MTPTGWFVVHDALALAPAGDEDGTDVHARDLGAHDAEHLLVRTVECVHGEVEVETICEPAFDYATEETRWTLVDRDGLAADASGGGVTLRLLGDIPLEVEGSVARGVRKLEAGGDLFLLPFVARGAGRPTRRRRRRRPGELHHRPVAPLAGGRDVP